MDIQKNYAFIDGQNLHLGTIKNGWKIDHKKLRIYLRDKYKIDYAFYFIGYISEKESKLYENLEKANFVVIFKKHNKYLLTNKKGNVDSDLIFQIMKNMCENKKLNQVVLLSGDGDYKKLIDYLITKNKFLKILFPNKEFASSLYKSLGNQYYDYLEKPIIKRKIEFSK